ncbi:hypothetical protein OS493_018299 [Desmophyllum pertusum]|uniref:Alpha/beta hydrolase fold-3 domain-containing protein n=1 Tax=Desmophyllum pertusum TaxID=174260 RepID=A0A9W9YBY4_9CNID|nr:hypothetical protein OS493_018299 [Desmophyllum pertusum]
MGPFSRWAHRPTRTRKEGHDEEPHSRTTSMSQVCLPIAKNPYMSPLLATDEMLKSLPPIDIVACTLDPILDDSVEFARRLRSWGRTWNFTS